MNRNIVLIALVIVLLAVSALAYLSRSKSSSSNEQAIESQSNSECSASLSFSISGNDTCQVSVSIFAKGCQGKKYEIKDRCSGTVTSNEETVPCAWTINAGEYTYNLIVDDESKSSVVISCLSPDEIKSSCANA